MGGGLAADSRRAEVGLQGGGSNGGGRVEAAAALMAVAAGWRQVQRRND